MFRRLILAGTIWLLVAVQTFAAISPYMVWQIQQTGDDSFGGGFRGGCELSTPLAPTVAASSGGSITAATYYVVVTLVTGNGETPKSAEQAVTTSAGTQTIIVTHPTNPGVQGSTWNVYLGTTSGGPYFTGTGGNGLSFTSNYTITATPPTTGTNPPGTDRSLGTSAFLVIDNSTVVCSTPGANSNTLTFVSGYTPTAADPGNIFHSTGGTNIRAGWYEIIGWTSTTWTVSGNGNLTTSGGAGSVITGKMGGSLATPGGFGAVDANAGVSHQTLYILYNASAYTCSGSSNVSGGYLSFSNSTAFIGYNTTRIKNNIDALRPTLNAGANSMTLVTMNGNDCMVANIIVTNSGAHTGVTGFNTNGSTINCKADSCNVGFSISAGNPGTGADCLANACTQGFSVAGNVTLERCVSLAHGANNGFAGNNNVRYIDCVAKGGTSSGFLSGGTFIGCISRDNSGLATSGFDSGIIQAINCIAYNNGQYNFAPDPSSAANYYQNRLWDCAGGAAGISNFSPPSTGAGPQTVGVQAIMIRNFVTLTADPHTNAAGGDLSLNNVSGGGALCRQSGIPGTFPGLSTVGYRAIGAVQPKIPTANIAQ